MPDNYLDEYYVAYGSNLNIEQMISRCPDALLIETETLHDRGLAIKGPIEGHGSLTLIKEPGGKVHVVLWKITRQDKEKLDRYEALNRLYEVEHFVLGGKKCFTYIMKNIYPTTSTTREYMEICEKGYEENGFDPIYLQSAITR